MAVSVYSSKTGKKYYGSSIGEAKEKRASAESNTEQKKKKSSSSSSSSSTQQTSAPKQNENLLYTPAAEEDLLYSPVPESQKRELEYQSRVNRDFTPDYSQMKKSKTVKKGGQVVGVEDYEASQSYGVAPIPEEEFKEKEKKRYKDSVAQGQVELIKERDRQKARASELMKAYRETGGNLKGNELKEFYSYYPGLQPTLLKGEQKPGYFEANLFRPFKAGVREGGLIGAINNPYRISEGERQFDNSFQKGVYLTAKSGAYVADIATAAGGVSAVDKLRTSQKAYETVKAGQTYRTLFSASKIGKVGSPLNVAAKTITGTGYTAGFSLMTAKVFEKYGEKRRNVGLDMQKQSQLYLEGEKKAAKTVGLVGGTLAANAASQAAGASYVVSDTVRTGNKLTAFNRGKDIFAAGFGEGTSIVYLAQERNLDKRPLLTRTLEIGAGGTLGGLGAAGIDYFISAPAAFAAKRNKGVLKTGAKGFSTAVEGAAYATDPFEYPGDFLEASFRGSGSFNTRPVRINTQTDSIFNKFKKGSLFGSGKTKTSSSSTSLTKSSTSLNKVGTQLSLNQNNMVQQLTNTDLMTDVNTNTNLNVNVPVNTKTDLSIKPNTNLKINPNTNVDTFVNTPVNTPVDTPVDTFVDTPVDTPVFVPRVPGVPLFALAGSAGINRPGRRRGKMQTRYAPSLLGIAQGRRATRTGNLSGLEIRGIQTPTKKKKGSKTLDFGLFKATPVKQGLSMKFKLQKPKPIKRESVGSNMIKRLRSVI